MSWWVYILRCGDGTLYTGTAADVERPTAGGGEPSIPGAGGRWRWSTGRSAPTGGRPSGGRRPSKSTGGRKRKH